MKKALLIICLLLLTTGCWDQRLLKDARLIYSASFDKASDGKLISTATIRSVQQVGGQAGGIAVNEYVVTKGNTPRETRQNLDSKISGEFDASKNRIVVIGKDLAKEDIYPIFDVFYRDPQSSLGAYVALIDGKASDILKLNRVGTTLVGEYLFLLIKTGVDNTYLEKYNIQTICPVLFDPGRDVAMPFMKIDKTHQSVDIKGLALLNSHVYSGVYLNRQESLLYLLMNHKKGKLARITSKVHEHEKSRIENYITYDVHKYKVIREESFDSSGHLKVRFNMTLNVAVSEYAKNHLSEKKVVKKLNQKLSGILTKNANSVLKKMQKANSDPLGIGRDIRAYHTEQWKKMKWKRDYPHIDLSANVTVKIMDNGIIN